MTSLQIVDVDTARSSRGLRLVVLTDVPSPWSQAALTIVEMKKIPAVVVKKSMRDKAVREWTGVPNAPVAVYDDEPPRSGWAEILELAERLQPEPSLVPKDPETRVRMFGLSHEIMGAGGLIWSARLNTLEASHASEGAKGFMLPVAQYLGQRYGYTPGCGPAAKERAIQILGLLGAQLRAAKDRGHAYYLGPEPSALDIYSAAAINTFAQLPPEQCPTHPMVRPAFDFMGAELGDALAPELLAHRDRVVERCFTLPLTM
jgi:glutathione S-transferase